MFGVAAGVAEKNITRDGRGVDAGPLHADAAGAVFLEDEVMGEFFEKALGGQENRFELNAGPFEEAADGDGLGGMQRIDLLGNPAEGLVEAHQQFFAVAGEQAFPRQAQEMAHAFDADLRKLVNGGGRKPQCGNGQRGEGLVQVIIIQHT